MPILETPRILYVVLMAAMAFGSFAKAQSNEFLSAAGRGDLPAVKALLKSGADVNEAQNTVLGATTALIEAASNGHMDVVQALIAAKADVNTTRGHNSKDGESALALAAQNGHLDVVRALLAANADVNGGVRPALYVAAMMGRLEIVRLLLTAKPDLEWRDPMLGTTALMQALAPWRDHLPSPLPAHDGRFEVARLLVEAGANVNAMTRTGVTPLMLVSEVNSPGGLAMVQTLLAAHADVNSRGTAGGTTLVPHSQGGQSFSYARGGYTALGLAASAGTLDVVKALLDSNALRAANPSLALNAKQPGGKTPLMLALEHDHADVAALLRSAGAQ